MESKEDCDQRRQAGSNISEEQQARARGTFKGLREHTIEIQGFGAICGPKIMANKELLDEKMDRIKNFEKYIEA